MTHTVSDFTSRPGEQHAIVTNLVVQAVTAGVQSSCTWLGSCWNRSNASLLVKPFGRVGSWSRSLQRASGCCCHHSPHFFLTWPCAPFTLATGVRPTTLCDSTLTPTLTQTPPYFTLFHPILHCSVVLTSLGHCLRSQQHIASLGSLRTLTHAGLTVNCKGTLWNVLVLCTKNMS